MRTMRAPDSEAKSLFINCKTKGNSCFTHSDIHCHKHTHTKTTSQQGSTLRSKSASRCMKSTLISHRTCHLFGEGGGGRLTPSQPGQLYQGWTKAQSMHVHLCTRFCRCSFLVTYQLPQKGTDRKGGERGGERQTEIQRENPHLVLGFERPVNHTGSPQDERVRDKLGGETE